MLLHIDGVTKTYRPRLRRRSGVRANDRVHLEVREGEVFGLLGHNGAGKTTLVSQVIGLLRPDAGTIRIDGHDCIADPGYARQACSLQPQAQLPINGLTPRRAVDLVGRLRGGTPASVRARRDSLFEALDIVAWADTDGEQLSGGVKRLVSFVMAAVVPGRIVILDEPTNDVDPVRRRLLWAQVRALGDEGAAVLLVTHNVLEAERAVDRLAILDGGRVIAEGTPAALKAEVAGGLRLELVFDPIVGAPRAAPFLERYRPNGSRATAIVPSERAGEAAGWAEGLRLTGAVNEYALTPATLEDVYVSLVGRGADGTAEPPDHPPLTIAHPQEVTDARAA
jgi:ABC-2 type transport system ATP-binding protein